MHSLTLKVKAPTQSRWIAGLLFHDVRVSLPDGTDGMIKGLSSLYIGKQAPGVNLGYGLISNGRTRKSGPWMDLSGLNAGDVITFEHF